MFFKRVGGSLLFALFLALCLSKTALAQAEPKKAYGILIDNTGSMRSQFDLVINLSKGIVGQIYGTGPVSVFLFKTTAGKEKSQAVISSGIEWTQDRSILDKYIDGIYVVPGQTTLMDAINEVATRLHARVSQDTNAFEGKIIFLVTDGEDRTSKISQKELLEALKKEGIKVYAIGLVNELDNESGFNRRSAKEKAVSFLQKLTKETGGRVVVPKSKKVDLGVLLNELFSK